MSILDTISTFFSSSVGASLLLATLLGAIAAILMSLGWIIGGESKTLRKQCDKAPDGNTTCCMGKSASCKEKKE